MMDLNNLRTLEYIVIEYITYSDIDMPNIIDYKIELLYSTVDTYSVVVLVYRIALGY